MRARLKVLTLAALLTGFGGMATAQQAPAGPRGPGGGPAPGRPEAPRAGGGVTAILNARRALDLTPRQVAQLDSIERGLHAERQRVTADMRPQLQQLRSRDSVATATAERLLTDAQRGTLREMRAERRGFERGMRAGREGGRGRQWQGPRGPRGPRGPGLRGQPGRQGRPDMMRTPQGQRPDTGRRAPDA